MRRVVAWVAAFWCVAAGSVGAEAYLLGPQDVLTVRVGHWDIVAGAWVGWEGLSGAYVVGADGRIDVPLAGAVEAGGRRTEEVAAAIADALGATVASRDPVQVAVGIASYRPVYVIGAVRAPGAYPYAPGLTVLQAIGLAGGPLQAVQDPLSGARGALGALGNYEVLNLSLLRALATEARLVAEGEGADGVETPEALAGVVLGDELMAREREIFVAREAALESGLSQLDDLEALLERQIDQLTEQAALRERQLGLANEELANITDLVDRGLTVAARLTELESRVADQEIRLLELATARLNAEQRLNEAGRERADLVNTRAREVAEALLEVRAEIAELRIRMRTEAAIFATAAQGDEAAGGLPDLSAPVMTLTRGAEAAAVDRATPMQPGDVLEVGVPVAAAAIPDALP